MYQDVFNNVTCSILMCTRNGEKYLEEQLDSILQQSFRNWVLHVSDDASTDATLLILQKYKKEFFKDKLYIHSGPSKGFAINFLSLASKPEIKSTFYAYCDQDDIWQKDKLLKAIESLENESNNYLLYCGRTRYVDQNGKAYDFSPLFKRKPSFNNALVQSIAGGNTMVFNRKTKSLLESYGCVDVVSHDWWTYLLVTAAGGQVIYDAEAHIEYRQHPSAIIGGNRGVKKFVSRAIKVAKGDFVEWITRNIEALLTHPSMLTEESFEQLQLFMKIRKASFLEKIMSSKEINVYRQSTLQNINLYLSLFFNRV